MNSNIKKKNSVCIIYVLIFLVVYFVRGRECFGLRCGDCLVNEGCMWCKDKVLVFDIM